MTGLLESYWSPPHHSPRPASPNTPDCLHPAPRPRRPHLDALSEALTFGRRGPLISLFHYRPLGSLWPGVIGQQQAGGPAGEWSSSGHLPDLGRTCFPDTPSPPYSTPGKERLGPYCMKVTPSRFSAFRCDKCLPSAFDFQGIDHL